MRSGFDLSARPILLKEMRSLMRHRRMPAVLFVCAALAVGVGLLLLALGVSHGIIPTPEDSARIGRNLFCWMMVLEALLAMILMPALTGGTIAREYQQQTMEALLLSRLPIRSIATGKLLASLALLGIIMLCALPVVAVAFVFGGVSPWELLCIQALILVVAACWGATGIYWSAHCRSDIHAITLTYLTTLAWVVFTVPFMVLSMLLRVFTMLRQALQKAGEPDQGVTPALMLIVSFFVFPLGVLLVLVPFLIEALLIVNLAAPFWMILFENDPDTILFCTLLLALFAVVQAVNIRFMLAAAERAIRHKWQGGPLP